MFMIVGEYDDVMHIEVLNAIGLCRAVFGFVESDDGVDEETYVVEHKVGHEKG